MQGISLKVLRILALFVSHPSSIEDAITQCGIYKYIVSLCQLASNHINKQIVYFLACSSALSCDSIYEISKQGYVSSIIYLLSHTKSTGTSILLCTLSAVLIKFRGSMYKVLKSLGREEVCAAAERAELSSLTESADEQ